jgi:hypothetical protein
MIRNVTFCLLLSLTTVCFSPVNAEQTVTEQSLTVAFLYNFLKLAEWPDDNQSRKLTVCVSQKNNIESEIEGINGKSIQNKTIQTLFIDIDHNGSKCQLIFISREEDASHIQKWMKDTEKSSTLLVSNIESFLDMGGMIALINNGERLQFEVNLDRVKESHIKLSSQMLKIARHIRGDLQ